MNKNFLLSKTIWIQIIAIVATFFPQVGEWMGSNAVTMTQVFAAINIIVRFITKGEVNVFGDDSDSSGGSGHSGYVEPPVKPVFSANTSGDVLPKTEGGDTTPRSSALSLMLCITAVGFWFALPSCSALSEASQNIGYTGTAYYRHDSGAKAGLDVDAKGGAKVWLRFPWDAPSGEVDADTIDLEENDVEISAAK